MDPRLLSRAAKVYLAAVTAFGLLGGLYLVSSGQVSEWDRGPILLFGLLTVLGPALSITYQGHLPSRIVHQIGSSFAYALFLLAPPGAVCLVLWVMAAADWAFNRRRPLTVLFNAGQLSLALLAALQLRHWLLPGFERLADIDAPTLRAALASLLVFSLVNHLLTHAIMCLASRRPLFPSRVLTQPAVLNELLCVVSGIGMAVFWWVNPWLVFLGVIPIWILMILLTQLSRREQELRARQADLGSLQGLGLELGAELDEERLRDSVVRIAGEALHASGAVFGVLDATHENLVVQAHVGVRPPPPSTIRIARLDDEFFRAGEILRVQNFTRERAGIPELAFLEATGLLCAPVEIRGRREGLLVLFHGVSRRPFDDDDLQRLGTLLRFVTVALSNAALVRELKEMQEQLALTEKMSAVGMLVSGVAHELNNPLTAVAGYSQILVGQEDDDTKRRMLEKVAGEAERAGNIVQNLLTFSRRNKPEKRLTDINHVLDQVLELREYDHRIQSVHVVRRMARELPPVLVDARQFQQVFLNLVTNAEDALRERKRRGRIVVETRDCGGWIQVIVSDDGPGIPAANLKKIFLPFFTTKEVGRGTGLGLSICYGIVQEHGGRIEVESRESQGSSFVVEIPTARARIEPGEPAAPPVPKPLPPPEAGRILVVDDEEAIGEMVREALEMHGWTVVTARDGSEALEVAEESDFDVLLVDLRMPGMDGRSFYEALGDTRPDLLRRVVFATGDIGNDDTARFLDATGRRVLGKPYDLRDLVDAVSRAAGGSSQVN